MPDAQQISVRDRFPTLDMIGVAVEHLPHYNRAPETGPSLHGHDMVEMVFILKGQGDHHVADSRYPLRPGALGIVHYGEQHLVTGGDLDLINIYLDTQRHAVPALPPPLSDSLPGILPLHARLRHKRNRVVHMQFPDCDAQEVAQTLLGLTREQNERRAGYPEAMRLHYQFFLIHCVRHLIDQGRQNVAPELPVNDQRLEALREYIDEAFGEPLTLAALADRYGMTRTHLCRTFKRYTGVTVFDYILQRRVERAMLLLVSTDGKVISVAYSCGFRDLSYFNRVFKRLAGVTPTAYRRCIGHG